MSKKYIETISNTEFNLNERSYAKSMRLQFTPAGYAMVFKNITTQKNIDNSVLASTIDLGKLLYENKKYYIDNIINAYNSYNNFVHQQFNMLARDDFSQPLLTIETTNVWKNKHFVKKLQNWFISCGFPNEYLKEEDKAILRPDDLIKVLFFCYNNYVLFLNLLSKKESKTIIYNVQYTFSTENNKIESTFNTLQDVINKDLVNWILGKGSNLNKCEYCGTYFFGRKNKKCCSNYCKDLKNRKYEKRKERKITQSNDSENKREQIQNND